MLKLLSDPFNISIVIPSHNRCEQLAKAMRHIAELNYPSKRLEVVVVLDGCNDGSNIMLKELCRDFPFELNFIEQAQGGPSAARNTGVLAAKGEYILFLDDDIIPTANLVKEHCRAHQENPRTVIVGTMSKPFDIHGPIWVRWEEYLLEKQYNEILSGKYNMTPRQFYTGNCSLKKEWIVEAGMFDENFKRFEDVELAYRLWKQNLSFYFAPGAVGYHYPKRGYKSWLKMHYLYGRYAVKIDRDKKLLEMIDITRREFKKRHKITQILAYSLVNKKFSQSILYFLLIALAQVLTIVGQEKRGFHLLSVIANVLFWQGFQEELNYQG